MMSALHALYPYFWSNCLAEGHCRKSNLSGCVLCTIPPSILKLATTPINLCNHVCTVFPSVSTLSIWSYFIPARFLLTFRAVVSFFWSKNLILLNNIKNPSSFQKQNSHFYFILFIIHITSY